MRAWGRDLTLAVRALRRVDEKVVRQGGGARFERVARVTPGFFRMLGSSQHAGIATAFAEHAGGLAAVWVPARRASRLRPAELLRPEHPV